ncbi:hypothetical protein CK203_101597 [Vitis vinifera]|uniref:Uncharacterized protein n=1 Tax=Vitis vinifera TaxID=29760 RepID=A0A438C481_VITVI|nr:hypothetical protein CK203_114297 [Vitis vinifera]RVW22929.1 hypothetical protein CK203_101597 [Vitis vinifera]
MASKKDYFADEIGVLSPNQFQVDELYAGESEAERVVHPEMEAGCMAGSDQKIGWCRMYVSIIFVVLLMVCLIIGKLDAEGTSGSSASGEHNSLAGCVYSA